jgi:hypothetical protein
LTSITLPETVKVLSFPRLPLISSSFLRIGTEPKFDGRKGGTYG